MKKLFRNLSVLCLALTAFLATGCYEEELPFLAVDHEVVLVGPASDKGTLVVESNVQWTASSEDEWITIDNGFGNHKGTFEFFVEANTTPNERSGKIILKDKDNLVQVTVLVRQQSEGSVLTLSTDQIGFTKYPGEYLMSVACNGPWEIASSADWCKVDPKSGNGNGAFKITVEENNTGADREAVISVLTEADGVTIVRKVVVNQLASNAALVVAPESKELTCEAAQFTLNVISVGTWAASVDCDWITIGTASGSGDGQIVVSVNENATGAAREAIITVATGAENENRVICQIPVYQYASNAALVVSPESQDLTAAASSFNLDVIAAGSWAASTDCAWLTLSKTSGEGDAQITVSASKNDTGLVREAVITFATGVENENRVIRQVVVRQSAVDFYLVVPVTDYPLSLDAQSIEIPFQVEGSNVTVSASSNVDWMKVASIGDGVATVNVMENKTAIAREGVISFITNGQQGAPIVRTVRVAQAPTINLLDVLADEYGVAWTGETFRIPIYSNTPVTARSSESWCNVSVDGQDVVVVVPQNNTAMPRESIVTVRTQSESGEILSRTTIIRQAAAYSELVVSPAEKNLYALAQSFVASIVTNNSWIASSDSDWLTIDANEGTGDYMLTVSLAKNETGQVRTAVVTVETGIENQKRETATITVTQRPEQFYFEVPTRSYLVSKMPTLIDVPFTTSGNEESVNASTNVDWLKVEKIGENVVNMRLDENKTAETRVGTLTITCTPVFGDPQTIDVTFTQSPTINILDAFVSEIFVSPKGDEVDLPYYANTPVSISSSETWCHVAVDIDPDSFKTTCCSYSDPQKIISIDVDPNRTAEPRIAYVTISTVSDAGEKLTRVITIYQAPLQASLTVTPKNIVIPARANEFDLSIYSTGTWSYSYDSAWLQNDPNFAAQAGFGDAIIHFSAGLNDTGAERSTVIMVVTGPENGERVEERIVVTQLERDTYIEIPINAYALTKEQQTLEVGYYAAGDFTDMQVNCSEDWIAYNAGSSDATTLVFNVAENTTPEPRTATVTVTLELKIGEPISDTFIVTQAPTVNILDVYVKEINASAWGEDFVLPFYGNTPVNVVSSNDSWCKVAFDKATDPGQIEIKVSKNEDAESRVAYVTVTTVTDKGEKLTHIITVNQASLNEALIVSPEKVVLPAHNASFSVKIGTKSSWGTNVECNWLTPDVALGEGDCVVSWTAADNETGLVREADVIVYTGSENEGRVEKHVQVIQLANDTYLEIPQDSFVVSKEAQSFVFTFFAAGDITNADWDASATWLDIATFDITSGAATIDVDENTTPEPRTATVTVTIERAGGEPITDSFTVTQAGTYNVLEALADYIVVLTEGETVVLPAITNVETLGKSISAPWLNANVTVDAATKTASVEIIADENTTGKDRIAAVTLYTATGKGETIAKTIKVFQPARDVLFSILTSDVLYITHESQDVMISAYANVNSDKISMESSSTWLSYKLRNDVDPIHNELYTAEENKTFSDRVALVKVNYTDEKGEVHEEYVTVVQAANDDYLESLVDYIVLNGTNGEAKTLSFLSNHDVTAETSSDWITVTATGTDVKIEAPANETGYDRTGYVTVVNDKLKVLVTVFQPARDQFFSLVTSDVLYITHDSQDIMISAYASSNSSSITMETSSDWLSYKLKNVAIPNLHNEVFTAAENKTFSDRQAIVKVNYTDDKGEKHEEFVVVVQAANDDYLESLVDYIVLNGMNGGAKTLSFLSNHDVTAQTSSDWITVTATGTDVKIEAPANDTGFDRTGYVTVANDKLKVVVTVFQPARDTYFSVLTADVVYIDNTAQDVMISAYASVNSDKITMESSSAWLSYKLRNDIDPIHNEVFSAAKNEDFATRTATVKISYEDEKGQKVEKTVTVIQSANDDVLEALVDYIVLDPKKEEIKKLSFISNKDVTAVASSAWLTLAASGTEVAIKGEINNTGADRTAYVTVTNGQLKKVVTVFQPAADHFFAVLTPDYVQIPKSETTVKIDAYASTLEAGIKMESGATWLTEVSHSAANNVMSYEFKAAKNTTGKARAASVKVSWTNENGEEFFEYVTVAQSATDDSDLVAIIDAIAVAAEGEEVILTYETNDALTATCSATWLTASIDNTKDPQQMKVVASANDTGKDRTAYITVSNGSESVIVTVFQPAKDVFFSIVTSDVLYITRESQDVMISAYANVNSDKVTMESNSAWLAYKLRNDIAPLHNEVFTAAENTTNEQRTATVKVSFEDEKGAKIEKFVTVIQAPAGNVLEALVDYIVLDPTTPEAKTLGFVSNKDVSATSSSAWVSATASGKEVTITGTENTTGADRTAYVTVSNGDLKVVVTVFQPAKGVFFSILTSDVLYITPETQDVMISAYANVNSDKVSMESSSAWLAYKSHSDAAPIHNEVFTAAENTSNEQRTATVKVSFEDEKGAKIEKFVTVIQAPAGNVLEALVDYIVLDPKNPQATTLSFVSNKDVTATSSAAWVSVTPSGKTVTITGTENTTGVERTAYVTVANGDLKVLVTVFQPAKEVLFSILTPDMVYINSDEQNVTVVAYAPAAPSTVNFMSNNTEWLTIDGSPIIDSERKMVAFKAKENTTGLAREAQIKVSYKDEKGVYHEEFVTIKQAAKLEVLEALVDYVALNADGTDVKTLEFVANADVTASVSDPWIVATPTGKTVEIKAGAANTTGAGRTGYVTVSNGDKKAVITVFQAAKDTYFEILTSEVLYVNHEAQTVMISAYANVNSDKISMESSSTWLTYASHSDVAPLHNEVFNVAANTTSEERMAVVKVNYIDEKGEVHDENVTVVQAPQNVVFDVPVDYLVMDADGETKNIGFISTTVPTVSASSAWITAGNSGAYLSIAAAKNTTGKSRTGYVQVTDGKNMAVIEVFQPAADAQFTLLNGPVPVGFAVTDVHIYAYASTGVSAATVGAISKELWMNVSAIDATSNPKVADITVHVTANTTGAARDGFITINMTDEKGENHQLEAQIVQSPSENILDIYVDEITFPTVGGKQQLPILSTAVTLTAKSSDNSWLTAPFATEFVQINAAENNTGSDREAYVTLTATFADGSVQKKVITVKQTGTEYYFILPVKNFSVDKNAQTVSVEYLCTENPAGDIKVYSNAAWVTANDLTNNPLVFDVAANPAVGGASRTAEIKVYYTAADKTPIEEVFWITQAPIEPLTVTVTAPALVAKTGGIVSVNYTTNKTLASVTASFDKTWVSAINLSTNPLTFNVESNLGAARSATATLTFTDVDGVVVVKTVTISQEAW